MRERRSDSGLGSQAPGRSVNECDCGGMPGRGGQQVTVEGLGARQGLRLCSLGQQPLARQDLGADVTHLDLAVESPSGCCRPGTEGAGRHQANRACRGPEVCGLGRQGGDGRARHCMGRGVGTDAGSCLAFESRRDLDWCSSLVCFLTCKSGYLELGVLRVAPKEGAE